MAVKGTGMLKTGKMASSSEFSMSLKDWAGVERSRLLPWSSADQRGNTQEPGLELSMRLVDP